MRSGMPLSGRKTGPRVPRLDPVRQGRFLAGNEAVRWPDDFFSHFGVAMLWRAPPWRCSLRRDGVAPDRDAHHDSIGAAQGAQVLRAIEDQVGCPGQEQLVLVAGRLALHAIDHDGPAPAERASASLIAVGNAPPPRPASPEASRLAKSVLPRSVAAERHVERAMRFDVSAQIGRMAEKMVDLRSGGAGLAL